MIMDQRFVGYARATRHSGSALGWNRTSDTRFRKPVLYPLSYEGPKEA
jgi:hypothetical protein